MYYYAVIQNLENGTSPMSITAKDSLDDARKQMNYDMYYALDQKDNYRSILCLVINELGNVVRMDSWEKPIVYRTVIFDSNGGIPIPSQQIVMEGENASVPDEPTKDGFIFDGWTLNGEPYDFTTPVDEDITLIAAWK